MLREPLGHMVGVVERFFEKALNVGVVGRVEDAPPLASVPDLAGQTQLREMLRDGRRCRPGHLREITHGVLAAQEHPEQSYACWLSQHGEGRDSDLHLIGGQLVGVRRRLHTCAHLHVV